MVGVTVVGVTVLGVTVVGEDVGGLLRWTSNGVTRLTATGSRVEVYAGSIVEVTALSTGQVVVQQEHETNKIFLVSDGRRQELLVGDDSQLLELEGSGLSTEGDPVVFYQRQQLGDPATARRTLRSFNVTTKEVMEVAVTGGHESSIHFSHLTGGIAVGHWSTEAAEGLTQIDLASGHQLFEIDSAELRCDDSPESIESACPIYDEATMFEGKAYGVRSTPDAGSDTVSERGIFRFDPATGTEELVISWPLDNGEWYPEDLFVLDGLIVMSVMSGNGQPLPAVVLDPASGQTWTLSEAAFVRPFPGG